MSRHKGYNLIEKGRTRKREAVPGDLFSIKIRGRGWLYGLVARTDVWVDDLGPFALVYVYDVVSLVRTPVPRLSREQLLLEPQPTNPTPWTSGKWEFLANVPLTEKLVFPRHCFRCVVFSKYYDEQAREIARPFKPCSIYAMANVTSLEYDIGCKLGLIPEDEA